LLTGLGDDNKLFIFAFNPIPSNLFNLLSLLDRFEGDINL